MGPDRPHCHLVVGRRRSGCTSKALQLAAQLAAARALPCFGVLVPTEAERDALRAGGCIDVWCIAEDYPKRWLYVIDDAHKMRQVDLVRVRATGADLVLVTHPVATELWLLLFAESCDNMFLHAPARAAAPTRPELELEQLGRLHALAHHAVVPAELPLQRAAAGLLRQCELAAGCGELGGESRAILRQERLAGGAGLALAIFLLAAIALSQAALRIHLWDSNGGAL